MTLGTVCHFHAEPHALPGFIECAEKMFDEIVLVSSPPDGTPPDEQTIEIAKKSGHRLIFDTISRGFGVLRTRCISYSKCDWLVIADADERLWPTAPHLSVTGTGKFPDTLTPDLTVTQRGMIDQHTTFREQIAKADREGSLALCLSRRHWFGAPGEWDYPCQNWNEGVGEPDWQLRCLKQSKWLCYDPDRKMHELLKDTRTWSEPKFIRANLDTGPFIDHYSFHFRKMEPEQNTEDIAIYEALEPGVTKDMWISHQPRK